ncbi:hypothetical protein [Corynebacterium bovis]|uniref:hypothetical protein n=1 Tax=Corynebacterium bovis TaxID=36808 RepID=UPI000FAD96BD|nr:hypothetical protein [Corynebacterium bovis]RRQ14501.1 hypothetical protein CXF47_01505 [Corynebacterium bovis]
MSPRRRPRDTGAPTVDVPVPRPVPTVTAGAPRSGPEVVAARIVTTPPGPTAAVGVVRAPGEGTGAGDDGASGGATTAPGRATGRVTLAADGVWEVSVHPDATATDTAAGTATDTAAGTAVDTAWRTAGADLVRRLSDLVSHHPVRAKRHLVQVEVPADAPLGGIRRFVVGLTVGGHGAAVGTRATAPAVRDVHLDTSRTRLADADVAAAVADGQVTGSATALARDIVNAPTATASPAWVAGVARDRAAGIPGVKVKVRDADWMCRKGLTGVLAAAAGTSRPPVLLEMVWDPEKAAASAASSGDDGDPASPGDGAGTIGSLGRDRATVVLVGEGVTAGGAGSVPAGAAPWAGEEARRCAVAGAAAVIAAVDALARLGARRKVVALVPLVDLTAVPAGAVPGAADMPVVTGSDTGGATAGASAGGGVAAPPGSTGVTVCGGAVGPVDGDPVRVYGGTVVDTAGCAAAGAAGRARLLLADAVGYGVHKYRPSRVVTVGCLSPDTVVALGDRTGAVVTRSRGQAQRVTRRAARAGERWWPLPVPTYLDAATASPTADVSLCPEGPGVLVAAAVLRRFAGDTPAVHLDLGGAAASRECREDTDPLGTGFGARSLVEWLR